MSDRVIDLDVPTIGAVRLRIFHACPAFHTGRALGPGVMGAWWAQLERGRWVYLWDIDNQRARYPLESAIDDALPSPADLVRADQDARAEAPNA